MVAVRQYAAHTPPRRLHAPEPTPEPERRATRLHRSGGSQGVIIPKPWLADLGADGEVDLVRTEEGILITRHESAAPSIEDEPAFAHFLKFVLEDALAHPETLGDPGDFLRDDEGLFVGVEPD